MENISRKQQLFNLISRDKKIEKKEAQNSETIPCVFFLFFAISQQKMYISRSLILHFYRVQYLHLRRICILLFHNKLTDGMVTYSIKTAHGLPHKNQWKLGIRYSSSALQYFNIRRMRSSSYSIYNKIKLKNETSLFEEHTVLLVI